MVLYSQYKTEYLSDVEATWPNPNKNQLSVPKHAKRSLLEKTCDLIRNFPEYLDVVVSVARKLMVVIG
ncbi:hypothetical protein Ahy_A01g003943 isoform D [Arachis hypogaea]|uniref:RIC1 C-terminal alpha solenoid region domain-containing protein n=1 Tax=Arachis hypogaea TaxID=3818 RepID=A0A445EU96_ARAHY|nr:hypothetical protein Ahy_A01g003943 isoform D [Arachis hypogaea]